MARRPASNPRLAVAYLRCSTEKQDLSPDSQRHQIEAWAVTEGVTVTAWHLDHGISGGSEIENRPGLIAAIGELRAIGAGILVVAKRDRLARDPYIAATIDRAVQKCGAKVIGADRIANGEDPASQFLRNILDSAAAYERQLIRARTKAALAVKKQRGERTGKIPYGFTVAEDGRTLVADERERAIIRRAKELREHGLKLAEIGEQLEREGLTGRTGRRYSAPQIHHLLRAAA